LFNYCRQCIDALLDDGFDKPSERDEGENILARVTKRVIKGVPRE